VKVLNKVLASALIIVVFSMVACSQKEGKKSKVNIGTPIGNSQQLQQQYAAQGADLVVLNIQRFQNYNYNDMQTKIQVGNDVKTIYMQHPTGYDNSMQAPQTQVGNLGVSAISHCFGTGCEHYVIMIESYQPGYGLLYQIGFYANFETGQVLNYIQSGDNPVSFDQMMNILFSPYQYQ
jgi:hypothetical protein